ncbi:hypothetical protein [Sinomonas humi]|uniref:Uncharacterized protein n=1 Tax=Sinomonas humi TaxID=1338436 RepID=A0A0B2APL3_9MICC|nr:hypothetical protein [Sinomonas humi]KHL03793.1 hypothetical protein LK10_08365 [Sinomonas humi]
MSAMAKDTSRAWRRREPRMPWSAEDEETVMREDLSAEQAAELLGRTLSAVIGRRQLLSYTRRPVLPLR